MTTAAPTTIIGPADDAVVVQVERLTRELGDLARAVVSIPSGDLAAVAAAASALVSAAEATRAAVVLEAYQRGVIAQSDHPRVDRWVEQSSREGGAPVARAQARQLKDVASVPDGGDLAAHGSEPDRGLRSPDPSRGRARHRDLHRGRGA